MHVFHRFQTKVGPPASPHSAQYSEHCRARRVFVCAKQWSGGSPTYIFGWGVVGVGGLHALQGIFTAWICTQSFAVKLLNTNGLKLGRSVCPEPGGPPVSAPIPIQHVLTHRARTCVQLADRAGVHLIHPLQPARRVGGREDRGEVDDVHRLDRLLPLHRWRHHPGAAAPLRRCAAEQPSCVLAPPCAATVCCCCSELLRVQSGQWRDHAREKCGGMLHHHWPAAQTA